MDKETGWRGRTWMWGMPIFNILRHPELCQKQSKINWGIKFPLFLFYSFPSQTLILSHGGYQTTRRVFSFIILSSKDPLSSIDASKDQTINHFFLWNGARVITHFALLDKGYGQGASTHRIKILSNWYAAIIRAGIYSNGLCHHIAFTVLCQRRNVELHKQISFFDAGKLLWFTYIAYSHYFLLLEKAPLPI